MKMYHQCHCLQIIHQNRSHCCLVNLLFHSCCFHSLSQITLTLIFTCSTLCACSSSSLLCTVFQPGIHLLPSLITLQLCISLPFILTYTYEFCLASTYLHVSTFPEFLSTCPLTLTTDQCHLHIIVGAHSKHG